MFCGKCGAKNQGNGQFCGKCGAAIESSPQPVNTQQVVMQQTTIPIQNHTKEPLSIQAVLEKLKRVNPKIYIAVIACMVLLVVRGVNAQDETGVDSSGERKVATNAQTEEEYYNAMVADLTNLEEYLHSNDADPDTLLSKCSDFVEAYPTEEMGYCYTAATYYALGMYDEASAIVQVGLTKVGEDSFQLEIVSGNLEEKVATKREVEAQMTALQNDADRLAAGIEYMKNKDYVSASIIFAQLVAENPGDMEYYRLMTECYLANNLLEGSFETVREVEESITGDTSTVDQMQETSTFLINELLNSFH